MLKNFRKNTLTLCKGNINEAIYQRFQNFKFIRQNYSYYQFTSINVDAVRLFLFTFTSVRSLNMTDLKNYNTLEGWFDDNLKDQSEDIANHGCVNGFSGVIYYSETVAKYDKYQEEIWNSLYEDADEQGINILELIATFNGAKDVGSNDQFKNLMVWYYIEKLARNQVLFQEALAANW